MLSILFNTVNYDISYDCCDISKARAYGVNTGLIRSNIPYRLSIPTQAKDINSGESGED